MNILYITFVNLSVPDFIFSKLFYHKILVFTFIDPMTSSGCHCPVCCPSLWMVHFCKFRDSHYFVISHSLGKFWLLSLSSFFQLLDLL